ncbi:MAG TPA: cytochrome c biogenesis protein CcsA [candidate division Zixibacteria bacterium]|jgi:cytochrome c-type biogenesis protein CcmF
MEILGKSAIWLATFGVAVAIIFNWLGERWVGQARLAFRAGAIAIVSALSLLLLLILTHRFEFMYVRNYSSTDLPLYYLIATLWGGQEGTLLLWIFYVSLLGLLLMRTARQFERVSVSVVGLFILSVLVILLKRSPFATSAAAPAEGAGLNPLLQDFWMTIHPPIMFLGFALVVFPFALAIAGWVRGEYKAWAPHAWTWLLGAWCTLATALVMGGYWAYKVLGWGGYWAWDPVENSSLIPWLFATGGIHSLVMFKKKNSLGRSAYLFSILPFLAVLYGSFLTRSGVLGDFSVHSFLDLGINSYLIASLGVFLTLGFGVLAWRGRHVRSTVAYGSMATVDFCVSVAVLSLLVAGALVLIGMSTPLWTRLFGPPSNVTLRYYFLATTPIALILLLSLSIFPFMKWIKPSKPFISPQAAYPYSFAMIVGAVAIILGVTEPLYLALLILGALAAASNTWLIVERWRQVRRIPGAYVAHVGLALIIVGAAVSTAYETKEQVPLPLGQPVETFGWVFTYQGKDLDVADGKTPFHILVEEPGTDNAYIASPRQFELPYGKGVMRKPAVKKFWGHDLYISPMDEVGGEGAGEVATATRGQTQSVGGFDITFLGFEMGEHGEGAMTHVSCPFEIVGDMVTDTIVPAIVADVSGSMSEVPAIFGNGRYALAVERIDATNAAVQLRFVDRENPHVEPPVFWVEIAEKPLINLFWAGTTIMVFGGLLALRKRARQLDEPPTATAASTPPKVARSAAQTYRPAVVPRQ